MTNKVNSVVIKTAQVENPSFSSPESHLLQLPLEIIAKVGLSLAPSESARLSITCKAGQEAISGSIEALRRIEWRERVRQFSEKGEKCCTSNESKQRLKACVSRLENMIDTLTLQNVGELEDQIHLEIASFLLVIEEGERNLLKKDCGEFLDFLIGKIGTQLIENVQEALKKKSPEVRNTLTKFIAAFSKHGGFYRIWKIAQEKQNAESRAVPFCNILAQMARELTEQHRLDEAIEMGNLLGVSTHEIVNLMSQATDMQEIPEFAVSRFYCDKLLKSIFTKIGAAISLQSSSAEICKMAQSITSEKARYFFVKEIIRQLIKVNNWSKIVELCNGVVLNGKLKNKLNVFVVYHNCEALCRNLKFKEVRDQISGIPDHIEKKSQIQRSVALWSVWFSLLNFFYAISWMAKNPFSSSDFNLSF